MADNTTNNDDNLENLPEHEQSFDERLEHATDADQADAQAEEALEQEAAETSSITAEATVSVDGSDVAAVEETLSTVLPAELSKEMRTSFLEYSMSVIVSRALPDVRDGLKPGSSSYSLRHERVRYYTKASALKIRTYRW